jgi:hypothetical protein
LTFSDPVHEFDAGDRRCGSPKLLEAGYPVRLLIQRQGDMTFENLLRRLRCKRCHAVKPAPVYLVAGHHRTARGGPDADWSIELAPPPEVKR